MTGALLEVEDLRVLLHSPSGPVHAVDGVSFRVEEATTVGIVGESGSGKTVLGRTILDLYESRVLAYRAGEVRYRGDDLLALDDESIRRIRGRRIAMVFQDPMTSLDPILTIGDQIVEQLRVHRDIDVAAARALAGELLVAVGLPDPERLLRARAHELSGGMRQRAMIAMAISCEPELLIADEPTTALDVTVQRQILDLLQRLGQERRMAILLVSHDLGVMASRTNRILVMYAGRIVEDAPTDTLFANPRMPYTEALLAATPRLDEPSHTRLRVIPGRPPNLVQPRVGCAFADRCEFVQDRCRTEEPPLAASPSDPDHRFRCWFPVGHDETGGGR